MILFVVTLVSFACGAHLVGYHLSFPRFLAGDMDSYHISKFIVAPENSWHENPGQSIFRRFQIYGFGDRRAYQLPSRTEDRYAIGQLVEVKQVNWLQLVYDVVLSILGLL